MNKDERIVLIVEKSRQNIEEGNPMPNFRIAKHGWLEWIIIGKKNAGTAEMFTFEVAV